jgi:hypothetical protein
VAGDDGDVRLDNGKMVSKNVLRQVGVGTKASSRSFGHGGAGGQIAWGDPQSGEVALQKASVVFELVVG